MQPYIPFVTTRDGCAILKHLYADAAAAQVKLDRIASLKADFPKSVPLWLDPGFEGFSFPEKDRSSDWKKFIATIPGHERFDDAAFVDNPDKPTVESFVNHLLTSCLSHHPQRISIPQWPIDLEQPRFKLNRMLAEASANWRAGKTTSADLILPIVFTHQSQLAVKDKRNKALAHVRTCLKRAQFGGVWSVDASLADQDGTGNFEKERFPCIIKFFDELRDLVGLTMHLTAGPYWGLNLLLWARGKIDHPAIGLGSSYQYHIHGRLIPRKAKTRVALAPLRRWATYSAELKAWLSENLPTLPTGSPAWNALNELLSKFNLYADEKAARQQIAQFYKNWFASLAANPPAGRALALFQDISSAYVLGKALTILPKDESARRPERVAQQLMLNCL